MAIFRFIVVLVLFGLLYALQPAAALSVAPTTLEYEVSAGRHARKSVVLANQSDTDIHIVPKIFVIESTDLYGFPKFGSDPSSAHSAEWFSFPDGPDIFLKAHETRTVPIVITVPSNVLPGGYYATVAWSEVRGSQGVSLSVLPGVNIALSVPGSVEERGRIPYFGLERHNRFVGKFPAKFVVHIRNEGKTHIIPDGAIEIRNMFGSTVARIPLTEQNSGAIRNSEKRGVLSRSRVIILPGTTREFIVAWSPRLAAGTYTAVLSVDAHGAGHMDSTFSFFAFSFQFAILILAAIVGIVVFLMYRAYTIITHHR